jgi:hypothetical protein
LSPPFSAQKREEAQQELRDSEIQFQVKSTNEKIDKLKRLIRDDQEVLAELRQCSDKQNEISVLKEQATKELEVLAETLTEHSYDLQKFNIQAPNPWPGTEGGDDRGDELLDALEKLASTISQKYDASQSKLSRVEGDASEKQRIVSEKSGLLAHSKQSLDSIRAKFDSATGDSESLGKFKRVVGTIRKSELDDGRTPTFDENDPKSIVSYLTSRLEEVDQLGGADIQPEAVKTIADCLKKLVGPPSLAKGQSDESVCTAQINHSSSLFIRLLKTMTSQMWHAPAACEISRRRMGNPTWRHSQSCQILSRSWAIQIAVLSFASVELKQRSTVL